MMMHGSLLKPLVVLLGGIAVTACTSNGSKVSLTPTSTLAVISDVRPVSKEHVLYRRIAVAPDVANMPDQIRSTILKVVSPQEVIEALQSDLRDANMLVDPGRQPKAILRVSYRSLDLPLAIGFSSNATAVFLYQLRRLKDGEVVFAREITTQAKFAGGDAASRLVGTGRAAVMANLASAVRCLDLAAYGRAPMDCGLVPTGEFSNPMQLYLPPFLSLPVATHSYSSG